MVTKSTGDDPTQAVKVTKKRKDRNRPMAGIRPDPRIGKVVERDPSPLPNQIT